jgi:GNAT superfamily N-acetyltransferase
MGVRATCVAGMIPAPKARIRQMHENLRRAVPDDARDVARCVHAAYGHYVERIGTQPGPMLDDYAAVLAREDVHVLERDARIAGVVVLMDRDGAMLLDNIAVHPEFQGEGLGDVLLTFAEERVRAKGFAHLDLYTHALMSENIAWYGRRGYAECARVHEKGFHRVYMRKQLTSTDSAS